MAQFDIFDTCDALIAYLRANMTVACNVELGEPETTESTKLILVKPVSDTEESTGTGASAYAETQTIEVHCLVEREDTRANINLLRDLVSDVKNVIRSSATGRMLNVSNSILGVYVAAAWSEVGFAQKVWRRGLLTVTATVEPGA